MNKLLFSVLFIAISIAVQGQTKVDPWVSFKSFIGKWTGQGGGEPGQGNYERSYQFIMNGKFIEVRNK